MADLYMVDSGKRQAITLGRELGGGGEAKVSVVNQLAQCAAKIYFPADKAMPEGARKGASREKLEAMLRRTPPGVELKLGNVTLPQLAWPSHLVEGPDGEVKGFLMRQASDIDLRAYMSRAQQLEQLSPEDRSLPRRLRICANLVAAVSEMHRMNHFMVDVKPENIAMFPGTGMLCLLDNDSFSIDDGQKRYPATALTAGYIAPELLRNAQPPAAVMTDWQDRFALAVLIFQVLNNGYHPFQGKPMPELMQKLDSDDWNTDLCAKEGWYPYAGKPATAPVVTVPSFSVHESWPLPLREMFDKALTSTQGSQRPSATDWWKHLDAYLKAEDAFQRCDAFPDEVTHIHFSGLPCHECAYAAAVQKNAAERLLQSKPKLRARISTDLSFNQTGRGAGADIVSSQTQTQTQTQAQTHAREDAVAEVARAEQSAAPVSSPAPVAPSKAPSRWKVALAAGAALVALLLALAMIWRNSEEASPSSSYAPAPANSDAMLATPAPASDASASAGVTAIAPSVNAQALAAPPAAPTDRAQALSRAMELAFTQNIDDALLVMAASRRSDDPIAQEAAQTLMRNTAFMQTFDSFSHERKKGRELAEKAKTLFDQGQRAKALELQLEAVGLAFEDRQLAADLAYYMALARHPMALRAALFALSLPRSPNRTATSTGWQSLGLAMTSAGRPVDAEGAMLVALTINPPGLRGNYCANLIAYEKSYGRELRPLVEKIFKVIRARAGTAPADPNCELPPKWLP